MKEHYRSIRQWFSNAPGLLLLAPALFGFSVFMLAAAQPLSAQTEPWFRTGTGLGDLNKPRVAVADFAPRTDSAKSHSQLFTQVVRDDLQFSGIIELVSPSFYPTQVPTIPAEL